MNALNLGVSSCAGTKGLHVRSFPASAGPCQHLKLFGVTRHIQHRGLQVFSQPEAAAEAGISKPSESTAVEVQSSTADASQEPNYTGTSKAGAADSTPQEASSDANTDKGPKESAPATDVQVQASQGQTDEWSPTQSASDWDAIPEKNNKGPWFLLATIFGLSVVTWQLNKVITETNASGGFPWQKKHQQATSTTSTTEQREALNQVKARVRQLSSDKDTNEAGSRHGLVAPSVAKSAALAAASTPTSATESDSPSGPAKATTSVELSQQAELQKAIEEALSASVQTSTKGRSDQQRTTSTAASDSVPTHSLQQEQADVTSTNLADAVKLAENNQGQPHSSTPQQTTAESSLTKEETSKTSALGSSQPVKDDAESNPGANDPSKSSASTEQQDKEAGVQGTFTGLNAAGSIFNRHQPPSGSRALPEASSAFTGLYSPLQRHSQLSSSGGISSTRVQQQQATSGPQRSTLGTTAPSSSVQDTSTQGSTDAGAGSASATLAVTVTPALVPTISKAVEASAADRMTADRTIPALREKAAVALRAAAAAGEASQRAAAYAAAASSAASRAAEAAQRAADAAAEAQAELETSSEAAITACERRAARAASVAQEAEARAAGAAAVATSYEDVGSTQASIAEKAARFSKPAPEPTESAGNAAAGGVSLPSIGTSSQALLHGIHNLWKSAVDGVTGAMGGHSSSH